MPGRLLLPVLRARRHGRHRPDQERHPDLAALGIADRAKSDWNRTGSWIHLFSEANYEGCSAVTTPRGKGNFYIDFRDFFDSVRFDGANGPSCFATLKGADKGTVITDSHG
ncbi:peptidase inhibitor family I36 protein [Nonomuraea antimicrobica]